LSSYDGPSYLFASFASLLLIGNKLDSNEINHLSRDHTHNEIIESIAVTADIVTMSLKRFSAV